MVNRTATSCLENDMLSFIKIFEKTYAESKNKSNCKKIIISAKSLFPRIAKGIIINANKNGRITNLFFIVGLFKTKNTNKTEGRSAEKCFNV